VSAADVLTPVWPPLPTQRAEADPLTTRLQPVLTAPRGIPQGLWDLALASPLSEFLSRPGKRFRSRLVELAWQLAGRTDPAPAGLTLIVEMIHAGSLIVDDIQDESIQRRGRAALHRQVGLPVALNTGNWLYFWPMTWLAELGLAPAIELQLHRETIAAIQRCHEGQALDLTAHIGSWHQDDLPHICRRISEWKTGSLMGLAARSGATAAGAAPEVQQAVAQFGVDLGVALQMQNDLSELNGAAGPIKHPEDLIHGRVTWPWAWAAERLPGSIFDGLQMRGARLAQGTGDAAKLATELLAALGPEPRRAAAEQMDHAYSALVAVVGRQPALIGLRQEMDRLLRHYS